MELWEKIKRFLLFWLCVFVLLFVAAVIVHWSDIVMWTNGQLQAAASALFTIVVLVFLLVFIFRSLF